MGPCASASVVSVVQIFDFVGQIEMHAAFCAHFAGNELVVIGFGLHYEPRFLTFN